MNISLVFLLGFLMVSTAAYSQTGDTSRSNSKYEQLIDYIKKESVGGVLDFNKALENEQGPFFLYEGIAYNKKDFAFLLWGMKVKMLGIKNEKEAISLYETILKRTLTDPERRALAKGFNSK